VASRVIRDAPSSRPLKYKRALFANTALCYGAYREASTAGEGIAQGGAVRARFGRLLDDDPRGGPRQADGQSTVIGVALGRRSKCGDERQRRLHVTRPGEAGERAHGERARLLHVQLVGRQALRRRWRDRPRRGARTADGHHAETVAMGGRMQGMKTLRFVVGAAIALAACGGGSGGSGNCGSQGTSCNVASDCCGGLTCSSATCVSASAACDATTCANGCCSNGACINTTTNAACGYGGHACEACPTGSTCTAYSSGVRQCAQEAQSCLSIGQTCEEESQCCAGMTCRIADSQCGKGDLFATCGQPTDCDTVYYTCKGWCTKSCINSAGCGPTGVCSAAQGGGNYCFPACDPSAGSGCSYWPGTTCKILTDPSHGTQYYGCAG